jgi:hypothetical protein
MYRSLIHMKDASDGDAKRNSEDIPGTCYVTPIFFFYTLNLFNRCQVLDPNIKWSIKNHKGDSSVQRQNDNYSCAIFTCWYAY